MPIRPIPPGGFDNSEFAPEEPSLLGQVGGGFVTGLRRDPFIRPVVNAAAELFPDISPEDLDALDRRLEGHRPAEIAAIAGEWLPTLALGVTAFGAGKAVANLGVRAVGRSFATRTGRDALTALAKSRGLRGQFGKLAVQSLDEIGEGARVVQGVTGIQRGAQIALGNSAVGSFVYGQEKARGKEDSEAIRSAIIATLIGAGFDTGITVLGKALIPRARARFRTGVDEAFDTVNPETGMSPRQVLQDAVDGKADQLGTLNAELQRIFGVGKMNEQLAFGFQKGLKLSKVPGKTGEKARGLFREKRLLESERRGLQRVLDEPGALIYTSDAPYRAGTFKSMLARLGIRGFSAPEAFFGKGAATNRIMTQVQRRNDIAEALGRQNEAVISELAEQTRKALGLSQKDFRKGVGLLLDTTHEWEKVGGGPVAIRTFLRSKGRSAADADTVIDAFEQKERLERHVLITKGRRIGGREEIDLSGALGVNRYTPHASIDLTDEQMVKRLMQVGFNQADADRVVAKATEHIDPRVLDEFSSNTSRGTGRVGPLDFNREIKGTLKDKIRKGLPLDANPFNASLRVVNAAERRIALDPVIGRKGRAIDTLVDAIRAEGGSATLANDVLSAVSGRRYYPEAMRKLAKTMTGLQVTLKLPFAVLANATQPQNTLAWGGAKPFFKTMALISNRTERRKLAQMLAVHHNVVRSIGRSFDDEGLTLGAMERAADFTLRRSGFDAVETFNRISAAGTAHFVIRDTIAKATRGRLRGELLRRRRTILNDMGLDLDDIVAKVRARGDDYLVSNEFRKLEEIATIRGAQRTQFFPGRTTRPVWWDHPIGKIATQFKTFAVGQGRFWRDVVFSEAANGNHLPMATLLAMAPITGEVVASSRFAIRGQRRDTDGIDRFVENFMYVGGLGIASDFVAAAQHRRLMSFMLGPNVTDAAQLGEAMLSGEFQRVVGNFRRQGAFTAVERLVQGAVLTGATIDEYLEEESEGIPERTVVDGGAARLRAIIESKR